MLMYDFECKDCSHVFEELVDNAESFPEECPKCSGTSFIRLLNAVMFPTVTVMDYPGSKRFKAGYQHKSICAPAEKKGRQISMHGAYKKKEK